MDEKSMKEKFLTATLVIGGLLFFVLFFNVIIALF